MKKMLIAKVVLAAAMPLVLFLVSIRPAYADFSKEDAIAFVRLHTKMVAPKLYEDYREPVKTHFVQWKTAKGLEYFFVGFSKEGSRAAFDALVQNCSQDGGGLIFISTGEKLLDDLLAEHASILTDPAHYEDVCYRTD